MSVPADPGVREAKALQKAKAFLPGLKANWGGGMIKTSASMIANYMTT